MIIAKDTVGEIKAELKNLLQKQSAIKYDLRVMGSYRYLYEFVHFIEEDNINVVFEQYGLTNKDNGLYIIHIEDIFFLIEFTSIRAHLFSFDNAYSRKLNLGGKSSVNNQKIFCDFIFQRAKEQLSFYEDFPDDYEKSIENIGRLITSNQLSLGLELFKCLRDEVIKMNRMTIDEE